MRHFYLFGCLFFSGFMLGQSGIDTCTVEMAISIEDLTIQIEQDTPLIVGDTSAYCSVADAMLPFGINAGDVALITISSDSAFMPFVAIVTNRTNGDVIDTLDEVGDTYTVTDKTLYYVEVIADSVGTGTIEIEGLGLAAGEVEDDTIEVRVIEPALPVVWAGELSYQPAGKYNEFNWAVSSELAVEGYELQRKTTFGNFEAVEYIVPLHDQVGTKYYRATDVIRASDEVYRVVQFDYDGQSSTTNLVTVMAAESAQDQLVLFPNPVTTMLNYRYGGGLSDLRLINLLGKSVLHVDQPSPGGALSVNGLPAGIYIFSAIDERGQRLTRRVRVR